jgi:hypothetical protein
MIDEAAENIQPTAGAYPLIRRVAPAGTWLVRIIPSMIYYGLQT